MGAISSVKIALRPEVSHQKDDSIECLGLNCKAELLLSSQNLSHPIKKNPMDGHSGEKESVIKPNFEYRLIQLRPFE